MATRGVVGPAASSRKLVPGSVPRSAPAIEAPLAGEPVARPKRASRGEIFIEGNYLTDRGAILKDMGQDPAPQKRLDPVAVSSGVSRLRSSGLFSRVSYDYVGKEIPW